MALQDAKTSFDYELCPYEEIISFAKYTSSSDTTYAGGMRF